jgi:hypothetical protein
MISPALSLMANRKVKEGRKSMTRPGMVIQSHELTYIAPDGRRILDIPSPNDRVNGGDEAMFEEPKYQRNTSDIPDSNLARKRNEDKHGRKKAKYRKFWIRHWSCNHQESEG